MVGNQRVRELVQAERKDPTEEDNGKGHLRSSKFETSFCITSTGKSMPCAGKTRLIPIGRIFFQLWTTMWMSSARIGRPGVRRRYHSFMAISPTNASPES